MLWEKHSKGINRVYRYYYKMAEEDIGELVKEAIHGKIMKVHWESSRLRQSDPCGIPLGPTDLGFRLPEITLHYRESYTFSLSPEKEIITKEFDALGHHDGTADIILTGKRYLISTGWVGIAHNFSIKGEQPHSYGTNGAKVYETLSIAEAAFYLRFRDVHSFVSSLCGIPCYWNLKPTLYEPLVPKPDELFRTPEQLQNDLFNAPRFQEESKEPIMVWR